MGMRGGEACGAESETAPRPIRFICGNSSPCRDEAEDACGGFRLLTGATGGSGCPRILPPPMGSGGDAELELPFVPSDESVEVPEELVAELTLLSARPPAIALPPRL